MSQQSHLIAPTPEADLAIVEEMAAELEDYIVQDELFRTIVARVPGQGDVKLQMTGGDLLARLYRLNAEKDTLTGEQKAKVEQLSASASTTIYSLKTRFNQRLQREMKSRLDTLRWFLDDMADGQNRGMANYPFEIRNRQAVEEILKQLGPDVPEDLRGQLANIDLRLRSFGGGPNFVWDARLKPYYPVSTYWYLYGG